MKKYFDKLFENIDVISTKLININSNHKCLIGKYIDHIFYINLEHRKDRKEQIESEIKKLDPNFSITERFNAIKTNKTKNKKIDGALGCSEFSFRNNKNM